MYQLITDSCCDLPYSLLDQHQVHLIPMEVQIDQNFFEDDLGRNFDQAAFLARLQEGALPSTSQISPNKYMEHFRPFLDQGKDILYIAFSSGLSGSYQSALQARSILLEEFPDANLLILDSLSASGGLGMLVLEACHLRDQGLSLQDLQVRLQLLQPKIQHWFTVDDLGHLYKGGRVSRTSAALGGLLQVKPILSVSQGGKLIPIDKVRTRKKSLHHLAQKAIQGADADSSFIITLSGDLEAGQTVKDLILQARPQAQVSIYPLGPTISSHTGYGCLALFFKGQDLKVADPE